MRKLDEVEDFDDWSDLAPKDPYGWEHDDESLTAAALAGLGCALDGDHRRRASMNQRR